MQNHQWCGGWRTWHSLPVVLFSPGSFGKICCHTAMVAITKSTDNKLQRALDRITGGFPPGLLSMNQITLLVCRTEPRLLAVWQHSLMLLQWLKYAKDDIVTLASYIFESVSIALKHQESDVNMHVTVNTQEYMECLTRTHGLVAENGFCKWGRWPSWKFNLVRRWLRASLLVVSFIKKIPLTWSSPAALQKSRPNKHCWRGLPFRPSHVNEMSTNKRTIDQVEGTREYIFANHCKTFNSGVERSLSTVSSVEYQ